MKNYKSSLFIITLCLVLLSLQIQSIAFAEMKGFEDIKGHWAEKEIIDATNRGFLTGVGDNKFAPDDFLTYEQFMAILGRILSSNNNFIQDKNSGCNLLLVDINKGYNDTQGNVSKVIKYNTDYEFNNKDLRNKLIRNSDYLAKNNITGTKGACPLSTWNLYNYSNSYGKPYQPDERKIQQLDGWAVESLYQVPYISGFVNYYNLTKNDGKNIKEFFIKDNEQFEYNTNGRDASTKYMQNRVIQVYDALNSRYIYGQKNKPLKRDDMALILYSFLDYEQQRLLSKKQGDLNLDAIMQDGVSSIDLVYRSFDSSYADIAPVFQIETIRHNSSLLTQSENLGYNYSISQNELMYTYQPEVLTFNSVIFKNKTENNKQADISGVYPMLLSDRGPILAVSDAGLLTGAYGEFKPKGNLTRAEGVIVALRLEKYIKERFNFSK